MNREHDVIRELQLAYKSLTSRRVRPRCDCDARRVALDVIRELRGESALDVIVPGEGIQLRACSTAVLVAVARECWYRYCYPRPRRARRIR